MNISNVRYGRTANLGNFESERLDIEIALEPGDDPEEALETAKQIVHDRLGLTAAPTS